LCFLCIFSCCVIRSCLDTLLQNICFYIHL
jgi:hypothetical protein